ncbi:MAG: hypothetical protein AAF539_15405 [Planctomycetota bacterium]
MVAAHAAVIGYVRSRVADLSDVPNAAYEVGQLRFQHAGEPDHVYQLQLHAIIEPTRRFHGERKLNQMRWPIIESAEQMLRQVDPAWLADPSHQDIREKLIDVVLQHLDEPLVQRILITDWVRART